MGRKSKAEERKLEILQHFYEVIKEEGFENASIAKIAKSMEVNPSLLIHYFNTKEDMILELVDFLLNRYESMFLQQIQRLQAPRDRFNKLLDIILGEEWLQAADDQSVFYACYYLATRNEQIRSRFQKMYHRFREVIEQEATIWHEHKIIKHNQPKEVAEYLIMLNEGLTYYEGIFQDAQQFKRRSQQIRKMAVRALC